MIRRTLSWRVLAVTLAVGLSAAVGAYWLHGWQLGRLSKSLLALAENREEEEKWREAASYLDRYLRIHSSDGEVRCRLASVYARGVVTPAERAAAIELHYRALASEPAKEEAVELRSRLARLLYDNRRFLESEREARAIIEVDAENADAHRALALAQFAQWENGSLAAIKLEDLHLLSVLETAQSLNPADTMLAEMTARLYRDHTVVVLAEHPEMSDAERFARADACLDDLIVRNEQIPQVYLARFRYRLRYELSDASLDVAKAMELARNDPEVILTAAKFAQHEATLAKEAGTPAAEAGNGFQRARELYQKLLTEESSNAAPDAYLGMGDVQLASGETDQAIATWRTGLKRFLTPTIQITFQARIADALLQANRDSDAREALAAVDTLIGSLGSSVARDTRLAIAQSQGLRRATWHMQRNEAALAVPLLQEVVARQVTGANTNVMAAAAWNLLGRANAQMGEWGEAAVAFDRAAPLDPKSHAARLAAAFAWLQVGRADLAVQRAEQALAIRSTAEGLLLLATGELERQRALPAKQRSLDRLQRMLNAFDADANIATSVSAPWRIDLLRADFALLRGMQEHDEVAGRNQAVAAIERAEAKYTDHEAFWPLAALAFQRLEDRNDADRAVARYAALKPALSDLAVIQSRLAVMRGDLVTAQQVLEETAPKASSGEQSKLRQEMISLAFAKGDVASAEQLLTVEAKYLPNDVSVLRRLCELALQRGDRAATSQWNQKLREAGSLGAWWARYFSAVQLVAAAEGAQDSRLRDALDEVTKLMVVRPHWPLPHSLRAMIEQRQGRLEEAVNAYEHAVQLGERRVSVFEQLVALLDRLNRTADAERYLSRLENQMPLSQRLTEIAANYELKRDHPEQAIQIAQNSVTKRPTDALAHLWLARLLLANQRAADAEIEFKKALDLAPNDIRAWNGLFTYHLRTGNIDRARQTLEELSNKAELAATDRSFVLAQGYEMLGDWKNAEGHYEKATAAEPQRADVHVRLATVHLRSDPKKAEQSLRRALELEPGSAAARRMLAALLATRGDDKQLEEAEKLLQYVDANAENVPVEDRRLNALLLAQYGDAKQGVRAAEMLEEVIAKPEEGTPGDRLVLARIYEAQARSSPDVNEANANREAALRHLTAVANQPGALPAHLAALIEYLLRNDRAEDAEQWFNKLEAVIDSQTRSEPAAIAQLIELRIRHGSLDQSQKWLDRLLMTDTDALRPIALQAAWLVAKGRSEQIEALVEPVASKIIGAATSDGERGRRARLIGDLYLTTKLTVQAERWYRTAVRLDAAQYPSQVRALVLGGQVAEAVRLCREQMRAHSTSYPAMVLASAFMEAKVSGSDEEAEAFFDSALHTYAGDVKLLYAIATLRAVQGRYEEAVRSYRQVLKSEPKNIAALNNLAMMLAEKPEGQVESLKLIDQAINIAGQQPGLLDTKGAILLYHGQAKEALYLLEAAAREAGKDARHRFHLAAAYQGVGDSTRAKVQLQAALEQELEKQVLTPTDRRMLTELKAALIN